MANKTRVKFKGYFKFSYARKSYTNWWREKEDGSRTAEASVFHRTLSFVNGVRDISKKKKEDNSPTKG